MEFKKAVKDILTNSDGISYSSKRIGGFISLFATIGYAFLMKPAIEGNLITLAGLTIAFFGLTSVDLKSALGKSDVDPNKI